MFDEDYDDIITTAGSDDLDDFDYYYSFIRALEDEYIERSEIISQLMDECDLERSEAIKIYKRYQAEKDDYDDEEDDDADGVDEDYGDGNSEA